MASKKELRKQLKKAVGRLAAAPTKNIGKRGVGMVGYGEDAKREIRVILQLVEQLQEESNDQ